MIYDELELKIKQVSADLSKLEEAIRLASPAYQRLLGYHTRLVEEFNERKEESTDVDTGTETKASHRT